MGNWAIVITGHGANHNKRAEIDADLIAREFTQRLIDAGQELSAAEFLYGQPEDLLPKKAEATAGPGSPPRPAVGTDPGARVREGGL